MPRSTTAWPQADVAIDFSLADAVPVNFPRLAARGMNIVIGATGWQADEPALRAEAEARGIGVVAAPNFAVGVNLFLALIERAAELWREQPAFGAWLHELHHAAKQDAPSGTALAIESAMRAHGYRHPIDVTSARAGSIPGTHTRRIRRGGGDDHADPHGAGSRRLRPRRAARRAVVAGQARLVHDAGRAGALTIVARFAALAAWGCAAPGSRGAARLAAREAADQVLRAARPRRGVQERSGVGPRETN